MRVDYIFLLTLSDIKTGKVLWDHEEIISKVADPSVSSEIERHNALRQREKEQQALMSKCKGGDDNACEALFEKVDIQGFKSACERQVGYACVRAGWYYTKNNDVKQSMLWYQKGCDIGNLVSCHDLGVKYYHMKNYTQAFKFFAKACDGGNMKACGNLGKLYAEGKGVKQDGAKALELFSKACESGEKYNCGRAGYIYFLGNGVKQDFMQAKSYYTKGCGLNDNWACYNLGVMYDNGEEGSKR